MKLAFLGVYVSICVPSFAHASGRLAPRSTITPLYRGPFQDAPFGNADVSESGAGFGVAPGLRPEAALTKHPWMACIVQKIYVFRGRRGDLIKVIWHDGQGACLFTN
jgi:hypothetical protein